jgi:hypothetical protein
MYPVETLQHLLKIDVNIIFPPAPKFLSDLFPSGFPAEIPFPLLFFPVRATDPAHRTLLNFITLLIFHYR